MMKKVAKSYQNGFSLVELMVVMVMMGVFTMAIFSLYQNTQRTASTQDIEVDLQQNLRIALDQMAQDIRMAGFMIPPTSTPIDVATINSFMLNTASASSRAARINQDFTLPDPTGTPNIAFAVASGNQANLFSIGNAVRIIRPPNQGNLFSADNLSIAGVSPSAPSLTITGFNGADANTQIRSGDIIVRIVSGSSNPNTITYSLSGRDLDRITDSGTVALDTAILASDFQQIQFGYLLDNGTELTSVSGTARENIRAVRVTLTGQANSAQGLKTRQLSSIITLRNR